MATYYLLMPGTLLYSGDLLDVPPSVGVGRGAPPVVVVDTTGRHGQPLRVFGTDGITSWWVRGARGSRTIDRNAYQLIDPLAPVNTPVIYYIVSPDGAETMVTQLVRGFAGGDLFTGLDGGRGVEFNRMDNGDPRTLGLDVVHFKVPGREPLPRYAPSTTGDSTVLARTEGATSRGLEEMLMASPLGVVHHNAARCQKPGCTIPRTQVVSVTAAPNVDVGTFDVARRDWTLSCTVIDDPHADIFTAASTYADFEAYHAGLTHAQFEEMYAGLSYDDLDRVVWT